MAGHFELIETQDASFLAGPLFSRVFGQAVPDFPHHFVCLYRSDDEVVRTAGYVHFSAFESVHLAGGLVVDRSLYPQIPTQHLAELRPCLSIGEYVMAGGIRRLPPSAAVFAFIGDARSIEVNVRVGYRRTHVDNLYAFWRKDLPEDAKRAIAERVARVAPF